MNVLNIIKYMILIISIHMTEYVLIEKSTCVDDLIKSWSFNCNDLPIYKCYSKIIEIIDKYSVFYL